MLGATTEFFILQELLLNANNYIRDILEDNVVLLALFIGPDFVLIQDNARPHTVRCVMRYRQKIEITILEWPAMSPDTNPIEHA